MISLFTKKTQLLCKCMLWREVTEGCLSPVSWEREMEWSCSGVITDALSTEGKLLLLHSTHILCSPKSIITGLRCLARIHSGPCMYRNSLNTCSTQVTWLKPNGMDYIPLLQRLLLSALISHILLKRINRIGLPEFLFHFWRLNWLIAFCVSILFALSLTLPLCVTVMHL